MESAPFDRTPRSADEVAGALLDRLFSADYEVNRQAALRASRIAEVVAYARQHPDIYVPYGESDAARFAERAAVLDISLRLHISEDQVRAQLATAETAMERLPLLWEQAINGFASMSLVTQVAGMTHRLRASVGADANEQDAARAAFAVVDQLAGTEVTSQSAAAVRQHVKALIDRLLGPDLSRRHAKALVDRRVNVEDDTDGMSWLSVYTRTVDARAAMRRLTSTAKHLQKHERDGRTRDQLRADLAVSWMLGEGTDRAVQTKVFVTIPVQLLAGEAVPYEHARVVGGDTIDPLTAKQMFLDAKAFHRVITDPVQGIVLDMDRRTYRPTRAQRDFLVLQHGTCARDGCERLALDADIDHERPWAVGGSTDVSSLRPLCPRDHVHRHGTRAVYRSRPDRTVQVITPTGFETSAPPPF